MYLNYITKKFNLTVNIFPPIELIIVNVHYTIARKVTYFCLCTTTARKHSNQLLQDFFFLYKIIPISQMFQPGQICSFLS